jgi:hypothetical protein
MFLRRLVSIVINMQGDQIGEFSPIGRLFTRWAFFWKLQQ